MTDDRRCVLLRVFSACRSLQFQGKERMILACIADHADLHGVSFPSLETIARETDSSMSTVQRGIKALRDRGFLSWRYGLHKSMTFRVEIDAIEAEAKQVTMTGEALQTGQHDRRSSVTVTEEAVHTGHGDVHTGHGDHLSSQEAPKKISVTWVKTEWNKVTDELAHR